MAARICVLFCSLLLLPWMLLSQTTAAQAEQALRARVTEFLQYHVEGNFRKAYDMVADDTKDNYFNTGKIQLKSFSVDKIEFTDSTFTKAKVTATMSKTIMVVGQELPSTMPYTITWKIENGKWVWYNEVKDAGPPMTLASIGNLLTPPAAIPAPTPVPGIDKSPDGLPKNLDDKALAEAARNILQQVSVDKNEVTLASDKSSDAKVIVHNGMGGAVQLEVNAPPVPGFTAKLEQPLVKAAGDTPVVFHFEPGDAPAARRDPIQVQLMVQPLNQVFTIRVNFAASK